MSADVFVVRLCVVLRTPLVGPAGERIVGYYRVHWVSAETEESAFAAALRTVDDGDVRIDASSVESAGSDFDPGDHRRLAGDSTGARVLRRSGRVLFPVEAQP